MEILLDLEFSKLYINLFCRGRRLDVPFLHRVADTEILHSAFCILHSAISAFPFALDNI